MSFAVIAHKKGANTNGGILGVAPATFYATPLTDMLVNDGAVQNFRAYGAGVGPNQFDLSPGNYRISADINIVQFIAVSPQSSMFASIGLYNVSAGRFEYHKTSTTSTIIACAPVVGGAGGPGPSISVGDEMATTINLQGEFAVTGAINTYEIRQVNGTPFGPLALAYMSEGDTLGESALVTAGGYSE